MLIRLIGHLIRNLSYATINTEQTTKMSSEIKRILIDLSGTLHIEDAAIPDSIESLNRLREYDVQIRFITNTSKESKTILYNRLTKMGFEIDSNEIFSTLSAAELYIRKNQLKPLLLVAPDAMEHFQEFSLPPDEKPNIVVIGLAPTELNYDNINRAFRCIMDGAKIMALNVGRYHKTCTGLSVGPGCFVKGLEYSTGTTALIIGKPSPDFFNTVLEGDKPEESIMIGDDVLDDVRGAQRIGIRGYLVKTGKYMMGDENKLEIPPAKVCENFSDVVNEIVSMLKKR